MFDDTITPSDFHAAAEARDWRVLGDGATAFFPIDGFAAAARFVAAIADLPSVAGHPPDVDVRPDGVTVRLLSADGDYMGMTRTDLQLAGAISTIARAQGLTADPTRIQSLLVVPGGADTAAVMPFWEAALGYVRRPDSPDEDLVDPRNRGTAFWFEQMRERRADGGGAIHVAVWLPPEQTEARVAAALAAGGRLVRDEYAPSWWTLADADGNEIDIASVAGRD